MFYTLGLVVALALPSASSVVSHQDTMIECRSPSCEQVRALLQNIADLILRTNGIDQEFIVRMVTNDISAKVNYRRIISFGASFLADSEVSQDESCLACILSHEIAHILNEPNPSLIVLYAADLFLMSDREFVADSVGVFLMVRAGYNPQSCFKLKERLLEIRRTLYHETLRVLEDSLTSQAQVDSLRIAIGAHPRLSREELVIRLGRALPATGRHLMRLRSFEPSVPHQGFRYYFTTEDEFRIMIRSIRNNAGN